MFPDVHTFITHRRTKGSTARSREVAGMVWRDVDSISLESDTVLVESWEFL